MWYIWLLFNQELLTCLQDQWARIISEVQVVLSLLLKEVEVKHLEPWKEEEEEDVEEVQEEADEETRTTIKMMICFGKLMGWEEH